MELHWRVTIAVDVMFVNGIPFLVSVSRRLKFLTCERIQKRTRPVLLKGVNNIAKIYKKRGFVVRTAFMDGEFEPRRPLLPDLDLNTTGANEHVPEVKRCIRVIKERVRAVFCTLPFKGITARMLVELIKFSTIWLNTFPANNGVSTEFSPRELILGTMLDYNLH